MLLNLNVGYFNFKYAIPYLGLDFFILIAHLVDREVLRRITTQV